MIAPLDGGAVPPARELRDHHKDLWLKFGREEAATIRQEYPLLENCF